jgi:hypothetical protein
MSSEEANKAVVRRFYAEMDAGNLDAMDLAGRDGRDGALAQLGIITLPSPG